MYLGLFVVFFFIQKKALRINDAGCCGSYFGPNMILGCINKIDLNYEIQKS